MSEFTKLVKVFVLSVLSVVVGGIIMLIDQQTERTGVVTDHIKDNCPKTENFVIVGGISYPVYDCSSFGKEPDGI